jgi:hypothetical protein
MENNVCQGCDFYKNGHCIKFRENGKCNYSSRAWLDLVERNEDAQYISDNRMCRWGSIFGNSYIGLTQSDIDRLKNGEVIHISGEYGIFIGFVDKTTN